MNLAFNIVVGVVFLIFLYLIVKKSFKIAFLYGLLIFQAVTIIPSLIYIETGIYISEQGRDSYFVGATLAYVIYFIITFIVIFATFSSLKKVKATTLTFTLKGKNLDLKIIYYMAVFALIILYFNASQSKLPLFDSSVTRFTYWENSKFPFLNKILGNTAIFIPFILGILNKNNKTKSLVLLVLYFAYNFMIGQKFSPILSGLFSFFLPIIFMSTQKVNLKKFFNRKIIISLLLIFGVAYLVIYKLYEQRRPYAVIKIYDPNEAMFYRAFGLQGHLMWGATETYVYNNEDHSYNLLDLSKGMQNLMYKFAVIKDKKGFEDSIGSGFNFTNAYPSILFYVFPVGIAVIVHVLLTIVFLGFMGWLLKQFIIHKSYVMAVITYQLFNWTMYAFTMGYFYKLKYTILFFICYGVFVVLNNKIKQGKNNLEKIQE